MTDFRLKMFGLDVAMKRAGGLKPFAEAIGVQGHTVMKWRKRGSIPMGMVPKIERMFNTTIRGNGKDHGEVPVLREAVIAVGSIRALAVLLGVELRTVVSWRDKGEVPFRWFPALRSLIAEYGVDRDRS